MFSFTIVFDRLYFSFDEAAYKMYELGADLVSSQGSEVRCQMSVSALSFLWAVESVVCDAEYVGQIKEINFDTIIKDIEEQFGESSVAWKQYDDFPQNTDRWYELAEIIDWGVKHNIDEIIDMKQAVDNYNME